MRRSCVPEFALQDGPDPETRPKKKKEASDIYETKPDAGKKGLKRCFPFSRRAFSGEVATERQKGER